MIAEPGASAPGLYFHVPFCRSRCLYCDFLSSTDLSDPTRLIRAMTEEYRMSGAGRDSAATLYVGGGTPSLLDPADFERMIRDIRLTEGAEETIEVNPDDATEALVAAWSEMGFNRLSLGIQSMDDGELARAGRRNRRTDNLRALYLAERFPGAVSVDLIAGLPGQTTDSLLRTLAEVTSRSVHHISLYALEGSREIAATIDPGSQAELLIRAWEFLTVAGFEQYEISNFALPTYRCLHNCNYWLRREYFGFGPGAHSCRRSMRSWNVGDVGEYIARIESGRSAEEGREMLTREETRRERIMLGLRLGEGVEAQLLPGEIIDEWENSGHCRRRGHRVVMTWSGWLLLNELLALI